MSWAAAGASWAARPARVPASATRRRFRERRWAKSSTARPAIPRSTPLLSSARCEPTYEGDGE
jgi:hypothetical protein